MCIRSSQGVENKEGQAPTPKRILSRVPQVTFVFWVIKCLATALGETMADQMSSSLGDSPSKALAVFACILIVFLSI
jgi:uncharacterized membrane-anchored protein